MIQITDLIGLELEYSLHCMLTLTHFFSAMFKLARSNSTQTRDIGVDREVGFGFIAFDNNI